MTEEGWFTKELKGRHVLMVLCGFFGVMFIVNGIFVSFRARDVQRRCTQSDPYRKGLHYNDMLAADERQAERGWQTTVAYDDKTQQLRVSLIDKAAEPVSGLHVAVMLSRPATSKDDRHLRLKEVSRGVYAADVGLAPGVWVLAISHARRTRGGEARSG